MCQEVIEEAIAKDEVAFMDVWSKLEAKYGASNIETVERFKKRLKPVLLNSFKCKCRQEVSPSSKEDPL